MNVRAVATLVVAFACITSVGVASTTLESSLSSTPDDVINIQHKDIPISRSDTGSLKRAITGPQEGAGTTSQTEPSDGSEKAQGESANGEKQRQQQSDDSSEKQQSDSNAEQQSESVGGTGPIPDPGQSWLPLLVAVVLLALLVRYRERVAAIFAPETNRAASEERTGVPTPANDVERAWLTIVGAARVENPWQKTPAECAAAAIENGLDPDAVERIRRVFEEVRYGEREVTEARRHEVQRNLSHLGVRTDGGEEDR